MEDTAVTQVVYFNALINFQDYRLQHRVRLVLSEITENYSRYTLIYVFKIKVIEYELTFPQKTKDLKIPPFFIKYTLDLYFFFSLLFKKSIFHSVSLIHIGYPIVSGSLQFISPRLLYIGFLVITPLNICKIIYLEQCLSLIYDKFLIYCICIFMW